MGQMDDLVCEIEKRVKRDERVFVTTLTKKMAEDLTDYFKEMSIKVKYLHSYIHDDEPDNRTSGGSGCPIDVAALKSHQFEGSLQPLEHWIGRIDFFIGIRHRLHTEEERQSLCCGHEEDAGADNHQLGSMLGYLYSQDRIR